MRRDDEAELVEELRARLRDSVRAHLVSDVPVGVLLSGGIDSSVLAALAAEELSEPLRTFSIGFEERSFDELGRRAARGRALRDRPPRARAAARRGAAAARAGRGLRRAVRGLVGAPDLPRLAARAEHVKVALSGDGGDELFGGYYTYAADLLAVRAGWTAPAPPPARRTPALVGAKASFDYRAKRFVRAAHLPPLERHHGWKEIFSPRRGPS